METNTALLIIITVLLTLITCLIVVFMFMVKGLKVEVKEISDKLDIYIERHTALETEHKLFKEGKFNIHI